ncbi:alpha/beta hydrolase [Rickettsia endosymbiont of Cardiosporidium cionae]|uniref:alpha/beta hydrolase n=1 Tax=Rickettsia endosymbiont of Cardiosporidium cionae TaxID=2777155 RepID=UPI0018942E39|nr:alpha/beta hydrolase [Rickettsia endosymbiont of Cardiosporidium cionae]KAF8818437.1 alpha/beta fold hydrolase [Rickettsia endosymbiont of Cardiosporidium cionae]
MSEVFFNGSSGRIEGSYTESCNNNAAKIALVLPPHTLYGGTMHNKVVYNSYKTLVKHEFNVLRINFRGSGRSEGVFDKGKGELLDAATALDWLQLRNPSANFVLIAGFSFGAWVAMQLIMRRPEIQHFIAIAPPVDKYDFTFLNPCPVSGLIIQGDLDSVVSENSVYNLSNKLIKQNNIDIEYRVIPGADHFFRNKIDIFNQELSDHLEKTSQNDYKNLHQLKNTTYKRHNQDTEVLLD